MLKQLIIGALILGGALPALAQGDIKAGEQKAVMCVACHGASGRSTSPLYPSLAGQSSEYLLQAMHAYRKGERNGGQAGIMRAYVASLSEADMANLAAYYHSQKAAQ